MPREYFFLRMLLVSSVPSVVAQLLLIPRLVNPCFINIYFRTSVASITIPFLCSPAFVRAFVVVNSSISLWKAAYARECVASPTLRCYSRGRPLASLPAGPLPIPNNSRHDPSTCSSHGLCGRSYGLLCMIISSRCNPVITVGFWVPLHMPIYWCSSLTMQVAGLDSVTWSNSRFDAQSHSSGTPMNLRTHLLPKACIHLFSLQFSVYISQQ